MKSSRYPLFTLIAMLALGAQAASVISAQQDEYLRFKAVINRDGWEVPGLKGSRQVKREPWPESKKVGKARVFLSILRPKGGRVMLDERSHYYAQEDGTLLVARVAIFTTSIMRYDVEGKPFSYVYFGPGARVSIAPNGQKQVAPVGCSGGVVYYDEDGDGVFERFETLLGTIGFEPRIPKWVTQFVPASAQQNKALQLTPR